MKFQDMISQIKSSDDKWEQQGMTCFVLQVPNSGHWDGYVISDKQIDNVNEIRVHGGITFELREGNRFMYGFDTVHYMDTLENRPREWVIEETKCLANEIQSYVQRGRLVLNFENLEQMNKFTTMLRDLNISYEIRDNEWFVKVL